MSVTNESLQQLSELAQGIGLEYKDVPGWGTESWWIGGKSLCADYDDFHHILIGRCRRLIDARGWEIHTHGNDVSLASAGTCDLVISSRSLCQNFVDAAIWVLKRKVMESDND